MFKNVMEWVSDDHSGTTKAVIVVSSCGSIVKRLEFLHWNKVNDGYSRRKEHIYPQTTNRGKARHSPGNYLTVSIRGTAYSVHRLVALAFIPNPQNKPQVNHIDGEKQNNAYENLEWVTNAENINHARRNGLFTIVRGNSHGMSKLEEGQVVEIKKQLENYKRGMLARLGREYGVGTTTIAEIKAGRSWSWL